MKHILLFGAWAVCAILLWVNPPSVHYAMAWFAFVVWAAYVNLKELPKWQHLSRERAAIIRLLADTPNPVIVDVGAYIGDEYDWMKNVFPAMNYLAVEADPRNVEHFRHRYPEANVIHGAIANTTWPIKFHQCDNDIKQGIGSGSIRAPKKHLEFFPWCRFDNTVTVQGYSLDAIYSAWLTPPTVTFPQVDLLWVDLQGAERDMIAGGNYALSRTRFMMIEAEEQLEFYEGQALKPELLAMLPDWDVVEDFGFNVLLKRK